MNGSNSTKSGGTDREARLKKALKANLQRRKAQARTRSENTSEQDERSATTDRSTDADAARNRQESD